MCLCKQADEELDVDVDVLNLFTVQKPALSIAYLYVKLPRIINQHVLYIRFSK